MKAPILKIAKFLFGWPLSIFALYFIWGMISPQWEEISGNLTRVNISLFSSGIISFVLFYFLRSYIWYILLKDQSIHVPLKQSTYLWAISEVKRYIPGKVWFVLGKTVAFSEFGISKKNTGLLLFIELEIFTITALIVSLLSAPFFLKYLITDIPLLKLLLTISFPLVTIITLLYIFNQRIIHRLPNNFAKLINPLLPKNSPVSITFMFFISIVSLIFYGLGNYFIISSIIYLDPQLIWQLVGIFNLSFLIGFLSFLTPSGLGVREGITAVSLTSFLTAGQAGFASLFARVLLIISELIFIALSFIWFKVKSSVTSPIEKRVAASPREAVLFCLFVIFTIYFTIVCFLRYDNFYTGRFDLGNMVQTVWNTSQGRIFLFTNPDSTETVSRLAFHADFILILLTPFYYLWQSPKLLLLIQVLVVGSGVFFVFAIARDALKNKNLALAFSFMYLINPSIQRALMYDFHAVTLATTFLLATFYYYYKKNYTRFIIFAILAALTKEQIWVIIALFGLCILFFRKKLVIGMSVFLVSVFMFYFLIWYAIPNAYGANHFALSYFSQFGESPAEVIKNTVFSPHKIFATILSPSRLTYLDQILAPVGYLPLFAPLYLIFAAPDLLINLLSSNDHLQQIYYQYTAAISPFLIIASIMAVKLLTKITNLNSLFFLFYIATTSLIGAYLYGPLPGGRGANLAMFTKPVENKELIKKYLSMIPQSSRVSASNNIGSHLAQRQHIYTVPRGLEEADYIVFLMSNPIDSKNEKGMVAKLRQNTAYELIIQKDEFIIFKKRGIISGT